MRAWESYVLFSHEVYSFKTNLAFSDATHAGDDKPPLLSYCITFTMNGAFDSVNQLRAASE